MTDPTLYYVHFSELSEIAADGPDYSAVVLAEAYDRDIKVLRSALAEVKYRIEQGRVWAGTKYELTGLHPHGQRKALDVIDAVLQPAATA